MRIFYALRKISKYAKDFFKYLIYAVFFLFVGVLAGLIPFFLISTVLSRFLSGAAVDTNLAVVVSVGIAICLILKTCCTNAGLIASHFLAYKTLQNMRERLAEKLLRMPMGPIIEKVLFRECGRYGADSGSCTSGGPRKFAFIFSGNRSIICGGLAYGTALSGSLAYRMYCVLGDAADQ